MIKDMQELNMAEVKEILGGLPDSDKKKQVEIFIKKFSKAKKEKAAELKKEISAMGLLKVKEEHIVKIVDISPEDSSDLNKIFVDVSLDEDETNKILETIKKHK